jgi:hypothetical protein
MENCYFVSLGAQKETIENYCFDKCGKICFGCLEIEGGQFLPCGEIKCPIMEKELDLKQSVRGQNIIIRKLKEKDDKTNQFMRA